MKMADRLQALNEKADPYRPLRRKLAGPRSDLDPKDEVLRLRLTKELKDAIQLRADSLGVTMGYLVRSCMEAELGLPPSLDRPSPSG